MVNEKKNNSMIQSLQLGMSIVELIASQEQPLKFSDIQELSNITKSNLYKYLNTLTHLGLLHRDKREGTYILGSKLIEYGVAAIGHQDTISKVTPYLQEISRNTSLTSLLAVWTYEGPVIANIWSSSQGLNIGAQIGTKLPILSSSGKIFSVFNDQALIKEWKTNELNLLSNEEQMLFEQETQEIKKNHIAFAKEPLVPFVSSISIPLFNYSASLLGAITVVGFSQHIPQTIESKTAAYLLNMSTEISNIFGYQKDKSAK
ncbi:IclR family transcriptional regulator [Bacillus aquiflavi]|uniref:IclR family transcriptional regulator n=1 Tax=Bacillus aquiflavi TaxID=2672567 RepID=A0A6B3W2N7_9BACI|nr:IclR family transcriptional regulator [Bacillus aquiflavi]MBA4538372.1 IclR family transcriptional regulator [Bacillus aquiflavi]NEY82737.1 IclR family transcriptional regulator [Bacillus aquiflavi]UAC49530.1 IclR family transcriptional regulator [Bacillus aquiflavi]